MQALQIVQSDETACLGGPPALLNKWRCARAGATSQRRLI
jgi:hypothetical protein